MTHSSEAPIAPHWAAFQNLWRKVAVTLFILLVLLWLLGYGPGGKHCQVSVDASDVAGDNAPVSQQTTAAGAMAGDAAGEYGIYSLTSDRNGHTARETHTLMVGEAAGIEGAAPIPGLDDAAIVRLILGDGYVAAAEFEEVDGRMVIKPGDAVSAATPWHYILTFFVTDAAGHSMMEIRTLIVKEEPK
ncbi:MAG: hypothetical protein ABFR19_02280 [Pseudomonadota bacterium]